MKSVKSTFFFNKSKNLKPMLIWRCLKLLYHQKKNFFFYFNCFQGITVDLSTLRQEWESRSAAASSGGGSNSLNGSFNFNNNESNGIDANEEIDVVGGLDSCSDSGSERIDSAADGSIDGESYPRVLSSSSDNNNPSTTTPTTIMTTSSTTTTNEQHQRRKLLLLPNHHQISLSGSNTSLHLNHQPGIHHWGLSLLERRRELVNLGVLGGNGAIRQTSIISDISQTSTALARNNSTVNLDDEVQSSSIDLSVKGREERRRLNPFSIDSLLGNNRCGTPDANHLHLHHHHKHQDLIKDSIPVSIIAGRDFKSPATSPASSVNSLPTSPTLT